MRVSALNYGPTDLLGDLRGLVAPESGGAYDEATWYQRARDVQSRIRTNPDLSNRVQREIWIYLSDADIRKTRGYSSFASSQTGAAIEAAEELVHGSSKVE